jgi:two-component system sensor histidine kinase RpfC
MAAPSNRSGHTISIGALTKGPEYEFTAEGLNEFQQAKIRVVILSAILIYFIAHYYLNNVPPSIIPTQPMVVLVGLFLAGSFVNILTFRPIPGKCHTRRIITLLVDTSVLSWGLHVGGDSSTVCFSIYLWLIVGYGLRYGQIYLLAGTIISSLEFTAVIFFTEYWADHITAGIGLLIGLLVLPIFFSSLLRKLTKAKAVAEEANKSKSQFLANMSHEIRTPLNGVIGMCDLLNSTSMTNEQKELAHTIHSSAHALLSIIEDVLDISKIEAGKFTIEVTDFDLHSLINSTIRMMRIQAESKGLKIASHISPSTPFNLIGDPHHLRQVFINLIGNAIKFTDSGSVDFRITTTSETDNTAHISFEVIDTGVGIPLKAQENIFNSFTQADSSTTRKFGGTGLGTTISKQIINLMGGEIGVYSVPGNGSTFWFNIPLTKQASREHHDYKDIINSLHVLVISPEYNHAINEILTDWNIDFQTVSDLDIAFGKLTDISSSNPYTTIIFVNTGMNNNQLFLDNLQSHPRTKYIPTILLVEKGNAADHDDRLHLLYTSILDIPINNSELFNALHAAGVDHLDSNNAANIFNIHQNGSKNISSYNILVAEDNPTNRLVISKILERAGHKSVLVENGQLALDELETNNYDLVIMDMQMPVMGGIEASKIYKFSTLPEDSIPIIILTADATIEARRQSEEANIDAYLTKPIEAKTHLKTVNSLCDNRNKHRKISHKNITQHDNTTVQNSDEYLPVIDYNTLNSVTALSSDKSFILVIINTFLQDTASLLIEMESALTKNNYDSFLEHIHAIKGSAGSIGAAQLHDYCKRTLTETRDSVDLITNLKEIKILFNKIEDELNKYLSIDEKAHIVSSS